jgi:APA family basic amino acid/polyamine antiporter
MPAFTGHGYDPSVTQLQRRLGIPAATAIGVASMLGAGIFFVWAPAAADAGAGILLALPLAGAVAALNALSTTRLAMAHPVSGGAYAYGRAELGALPGFVAGVLFLVGKTASVAAIASIAGAYLWPDFARPVAVAAVVVLAIVNASGIRSTAVVSTVIAALVVAALVSVLIVSAVQGAGLPPRSPVSFAGGVLGVLQAAALIFFTFAGYARIATLGEEVRDPERTLPRAVIAALAIVLLLSAATAAVLLLRLGTHALTTSGSPLADAVGPGAGAVIRITAAVACLGSLLSVLAGLSRTSLAMARDGELPARLAGISQRTATPVLAELVVAVVGVAAVLLLDPARLVGVSACAVLGYYAIAHLASFGRARRLGVRPPATAVLGLLGCAALALSTPWQAIAAVVVLVLAAVGVRALVRIIRRRRTA